MTLSLSAPRFFSTDSTREVFGTTIAGAGSAGPSPSSEPPASTSIPFRRFSRHQQVILIVGSGRVGRTLCHMLGAEPNYIPRICDNKPEAAAAVANEVPALPGMVQPVRFRVDDKQSLRMAMEGVNAVISAAPASANALIAETAAEVGVHYFDLTEDPAVLKGIKSLSERPDNRSVFAPQCGVSPGFVTLAATRIIQQFDSVDTLQLRVGALPDQPNNRLKYNLTWGTEGLVRDYVNPCVCLRDGVIATVPALCDKEDVIIGGQQYEAFNTPGGMGSMAYTYEYKIRHLDFKSIRYPGHLELVRFLLEDLRFSQHPEELIKVFSRSVPATLDDVVIISVRALGYDRGKFMEKTYWRKIHGRYIGNLFFTGIEVATAAGVCGIVDRVLHGKLPARGFIKMEDVSFNGFMETAFGKYYARGDRSE